MNRSAPFPAFAYGVSLAGLAAAVLLRWVLDPVLGDTLPLVTLFAAIAVAVWMGGYRPALLVVVLGFLACSYLFIHPRGGFGMSEPRNLVGLLLYLATAFIVVFFGEALRRARRHHRLGEEAARRLAELLRTTLASIGDGVISTDPDGRVTSMNTVAEVLTGWVNAQAVGLPVTEVFRIVNESTRMEVENPALRALKQGEIVGLANHTILIAEDGTERFIDDSAAPIRSEQGEVIGSVLVFRDISERYRGEAGHRAAQEQIARTLESVTDGFMRYDRDWRIVYINAEAERINRLSRSEMLGRIVWEVFPALVGTNFEAEFRRAVADRVTIEFENYYEPFGRWYSLKGYPTEDGGLTTFIRDITSQKDSETALRASEERSEFVRRSSGVGFWYCDLPFEVLQWDEQVKAHFHLPPDAIVTIDTFYERIHPDDREPTRQAIERSITGRMPYDVDYRTVDPDTGNVNWVRAIGRTFYATDGTPTRFDGVTLDVSARKMAEQEVIRIAAESERQRRLYETVLTNTPDFVYVFSLDHKVLYANDALIKMWGRGYEGAIGKTFLEIGYEPWHAEMHDREIDQVRTTRKPIRGEVPFNGTQGLRQYDYIFVPVFGADGEVEAVAGTTRDVTERKETERQLKESEERQAFLVKLTDTLRPLADPVEVQAEASRVLGEWLGANRVAYFEIREDEYVVEWDYTVDARPIAGRYPVDSFGSALLDAFLEGRTVIEADATTEPDRPPGERAAFAAIQVRGHVDVPLVKNGRFLAGMTVQFSERRDWTRQEIVLIEDTAERTWASVERVRAEAALRQSEERRRLALDAAELGSWQIDLETNTFTTDERFRTIFAGTAEAMDYEQAVALIHPDDQERIRERVAATAHSLNPAPFAEEYRVVHPEGAIRWVFAQGRVNYDRDRTERPVSFDGTVADITARKLIEEERERLVCQLQDQDKRKDEFLATLAHELRNPLAPINYGLEIMRLAGVTGMVEDARAVMERQLTQLIRLVDDLLDVSRVTSGKLALRRERVELRAIVNAAIETSRPALEQAGHQWTIAVPDDPIFVDGDATRLAQIVSNLLNNSAKYTPAGGNIRLTVRREEDMAVVVVADDGIGIPPNMVGKVFEMFAQVDRTLEKTTGGLGIGLSLVKGLVELHAGTIEARSAGEGQGSEFITRLPMVSSAARKEEAPVVEKAIGSFRILVADDNVDSTQALERLLKLLGNDVTTANDGLEALKAAESFRPDLLLLDIGMPKLNGYEVCRRIREQPWGRDAVVVAMTGWGQEEDKRRSREAGFDLHLVKPADFEAIKKLLSSLKPAVASVEISAASP